MQSCLLINYSLISNAWYTTSCYCQQCFIKKAGLETSTIFLLFQFDIGIMSQVREKLSDASIRCSSWRSAGRLEPSPTGSLTDHVVVLTGKVVARRTDEDGEVHVLQRWTPENL